MENKVLPGQSYQPTSLPGRFTQRPPGIRTPAYTPARHPTIAVETSGARLHLALSLGVLVLWSLQSVRCVPRQLSRSITPIGFGARCTPTRARCLAGFGGTIYVHEPAIDSTFGEYYTWLVDRYPIMPPLREEPHPKANMRLAFQRTTFPPRQVHRQATRVLPV